MAKKYAEYKTLTFLVQYRDDVHPWWETIAAFNCEEAATPYAKTCHHHNFDRVADRYQRRWRCVEKCQHHLRTVWEGEP